MPPTLSSPSRPELLRRAAVARGLLSSCTLCERRCGINRLKGEPTPCGLGDQTWCFKRHTSYAEEVDLLPSYMVYLGGCNFRCRFCVQAPSCFSPRGGVKVEPGEAAADFLRVVGRGARTINLLGGEPSLHLHTILEIAAAAGEPLPLLLNSNMYMTPEVIELLDGVVSMYIADFKFGNDSCARNLAGIDRYVEIVTRNLLLAQERAGLIVRHLVMPGHVDCCLEPVARWLAANVPGARTTLMTGYVPGWRAAADQGPMGRCLDEDEVKRAEARWRAYGLAVEGDSP